LDLVWQALLLPVSKAVNTPAPSIHPVESRGWGTCAMRLRRAFPLVVALAVLPLGPAAAQLGGIPESPGVSPGAGSPFGQAPRQPPPTMVKGLEEHSATCGVPAEVIRQVKAQHGRASQMAAQVCMVVVQGTPPRLYAPAPQCAEKALVPGVPCVD
jgi:hypothetical protein